jgi:hypothetical protein
VLYRRAIALLSAALYTVVSTAMDELETYARAAARVTDLEIDELWWPGVVRHLAVLFDRAALVEAVDLDAAPPVAAGEP